MYVYIFHILTYINSLYLLIAIVSSIFYLILVAELTSWDRKACRNAPVCLDSPIYLDTPICMDAPCTFGHPCMYRHSHMFGCPPYV